MSDSLSSHKFDYQSDTSLKARRHLLLPAFTTFLATLVTIGLSYAAYGYHLDQQSLADIRSMEIIGPVSSHYLGRKKVDKWGRLKRRSSAVTCGEMWSNFQTCSDNAVLHSNCIEICDSSYNTCTGCDALQSNHQAQLDTANRHCATKRDARCDLNTVNGKLDYASFSTCCLSAAGPIGADACFCEQQQLAPCFGYGQCQTCDIESLACPGTLTSPPVQPPGCDDVAATKCDGPGTNQATECGHVDGTHYFLQINSKTCKTTCDVGVPATDPITGFYTICSLASFYTDASYSEVVGCVPTSSDRPALSIPLVTAGNGALVTPEACSSKCKSIGFTYCGLSNGGECFGDFGVHYFQTDINQCTEVCALDSAHFCGGTSPMIVIAH